MNTLIIIWLIISAGTLFRHTDCIKDKTQELSQTKEKGIVGTQLLKVDEGPYFFFDDRVVSIKEGMKLSVLSPEKYEGNPIVPSVNPYHDFHLTTGANTVLPEEGGEGFRMWYTLYKRGESGTHQGYAVSSDGIEWTLPNPGIIDFKGNKNNNLLMTQVLTGRVFADPNPALPYEKYKAILYRHQPRPVGFSVSFSSDGLKWSSPDWIKELDDRKEIDLQGQGASDVVNAFYDSKRGEWVAVFKMWSLEGQYTTEVKRGIPAPRCGRRIIGMSRSRDFHSWTRAEQIVLPDDQDPPTLEFYGMQTVIHRGDWYIGFIPCLIDDAIPDGIGWTELAISLDGNSWQRIRQKFLDRSVENTNAPDHAIAWVTDVIQVEDLEYIYYSGLQVGHKAGDRSGCMGFIGKNRFMAMEPVSERGSMVTNFIILPQDEKLSLVLNVDADGGEVRVQISDGEKVLKGYSFSDCDPVTVNSTSAPVLWKGRSDLPQINRPLKMEFQIRNAGLFTFNLFNTSVVF